MHIVTTDAATKLSTTGIVGRGNEDSGVNSLGSLGGALLIGTSSPMSPMSPMSALLNERGRVTVETEVSQSEDGSTSEEEDGDNGEEEEGDEDEDGHDIEENDTDADTGDDKGEGAEGNEDRDGEDEVRDLRCSNAATLSPSTTPSTTDATTSPLPDNTN